MTGTISPDGSIGPVGLIPFKLKAAAEAGFETVLLPAALTTMLNPASGEPMNIVDYAKDLNIQVKFVRTLDEAYEHFTGRQLTKDGEASPFSFANFTQLDSARTQAATTLHAEVTRRLQNSPDAPAAVREQLQESQQAISVGDVNTGFALAVDALNLLEHWRGSTAFEQSVTETGLQQSRMQLREQVSVMLDEVNQQLTEALQDTPNFDMAQSLSVPGAIAWLTYARAIFVSLQDSLESSELEQQPEVLVAYAGLASQVNAETETVFPATQLVIDALPASSLPSAPPVADYISGYTNFLVAAGDANLT